ncbi:MAG: hypothetical protein EBZ36_01430, partial [Acidobacteria bacterium]|nr:hypothetical protein [Acidobacteriota bacterium]
MSPLPTLFDAPELSAWTMTNPAFDWLVERLSRERLSVEESEILAEMGTGADEISLRDDSRFRRTPYARWILTDLYLANETLFDYLNNSPVPIANLAHWLAGFERQFGLRSVFCQGDPRFVLTGSVLRLAKGELSDEPLIETLVGEGSQYVTHLPLLRLWDAVYGYDQTNPGNDILILDDSSAAQTLGWIRVYLPTPLDRRMFIARIEDDSTLSKSGGVGRCDYAVFSWQWRESDDEGVVLVRGLNGLTGRGFYCLRRVRRDGAQIILEPLNQDQARYPLMVLREADDHLLEVVAELRYALKPSMYNCAPVGVKEKDDCRAEHRQVRRLATGVDKFFGRSGVAQNAKPAEMRAKVICGEPGPGCLQIEIGPFPSFPSFIHHLLLSGDGWEKEVELERIRKRPVRVTVPPWVSRLSWRVARSADEVPIDLDSLGLDGLPTDQVTIFRLDNDEVGRLVKESRLALTESYRILIPPGRLAMLDVPPPVVPIGSGWSVWSLDGMATANRPLLVEQLSELDLELHQEALPLDFVIVPPAEWCRMGGTGAYPRFLTSTGTVVSLGHPRASVDCQSSLLLLTPAGHQFRSIPAGSPPLLRLTDLKPGQYGLQLFDQDGVREPSERYFEVVEEAPDYPGATCRFALGGDWVDLEAGKERRESWTDLRLLDSPGGGKSPLMLRIEAPAGWPLTVSWRSASMEPLYRAHADQNGGYDIEAILAATHQRRHQLPVGELILDLRELGRVAIPHRRQMDLRTIHSALTELVIARGTMVQHARGEYLTTIPLWFEPVLRLLGYSTAECPRVDMPAGTRVL